MIECWIVFSAMWGNPKKSAPERQELIQGPSGLLNALCCAPKCSWITQFLRQITKTPQTEITQQCSRAGDGEEPACTLPMSQHQRWEPPVENELKLFTGTQYWLEKDRRGRQRTDRTATCNVGKITVSRLNQSEANHRKLSEGSSVVRF